MKMVWDQDPIKEYSDIFTQNLIPSKVASVCSSFQRKIMETMASLEISLQTYSTEKEEKKAMQQIMQSSRMMPIVIGVANRYAFFMERKSNGQMKEPLGSSHHLIIVLLRGLSN